MPDRQRRHDDIDHPLERATDKSPFQQLNAKIAEYRTLIYLGVGILAWFGWRTESPSARTDRLERQVFALADSIKSVKDSVAALRRGQIDTHNGLEVLIRLRCFDPALFPSQMRLAGLDCSDITAARRADSLATFKKPIP